MKSNPYLLLLSTIVLAVIIGCTDGNAERGDEPSKEADKQSEAASQGNSTTFEDVQEKAGEAAQVAREFTAQEMQDYRDTLQQQLEELDNRREELKNKGEDLAGDAKQRWNDRMNDLDDKRKKLQTDLNKLTDASGSAWQKLKVGLDLAWEDLKNATDEASKEFE